MSLRGEVAERLTAAVAGYLGSKWTAYAIAQ
jgi:hypothetical protein